MTDQLSRITVKDAHSSGPVDGLTVIHGFIVKVEPEALIKREIVRPVEPDEPDTENEVGYSHDALEPLVIEYRHRKVKLTETLYLLFRYVYDIYRTEGQTEFDFCELAEVLRGSDCKWGKRAIEASIYRLKGSLSKIIAPITVTHRREMLYVVHKIVNEN